MSYLLAPHFGRKTPSIDTLLGRKDPSAITRPDGLIVSGDAVLLSVLLDGPDAAATARDVQVQQFLAHVQAQKEEGAAN